MGTVNELAGQEWAVRGPWVSPNGKGGNNNVTVCNNGCNVGAMSHPVSVRGRYRGSGSRNGMWGVKVCVM